MDNYEYNAKQVIAVSCVLNEIINYLCYSSIWGPIHVVTFNTVVFMLTMAHLKAVLSDPGKVPLPQSRLDFSDLHSLQTSKKTDMEREEWTVSLILFIIHFQVK